MITIKSVSELEIMKKGGKILKQTFELLEGRLKSGVETEELDDIAKAFINKNNALPTFLNFNGYPKSICVSIDEEVVHGIPGKRKLEEGQIVSIDIGVNFEGFNTDAARTYGIGKISKEKQQLIDVTKQSFFKATENLKSGSHVSDIGKIIQEYTESFGYGVVRALVGHGIGRELHEDPQIPNFRTAGSGALLKTGMTIAIEPMINMGTHEVSWQKDGWTVCTRDKKPSAHYENTLIIEDGGVEIITL